MINLLDIKSSLESKNKFWIVFTGDSLTSCEWVHPNWREIVEYVLKEELTKLLNGDWKISEWGIRAFNFAYDGSTTKDIVEKIDDIILVKPDLVIGLMGGNDPIFAISIAESIANIKSIAHAITAYGAAFVWSTSTPAGKESTKNEEYEPYAKSLMNSISNDENLQIIDMFTIYKQFPLERFFTFTSEANFAEGIQEGDPDLQHPNQLGNAYIAQVILQNVFSIKFNPERYMQTTLQGEKYPQY